MQHPKAREMLQREAIGLAVRAEWVDGISALINVGCQVNGVLFYYDQLLTALHFGVSKNLPLDAILKPLVDLGATVEEQYIFNEYIPSVMAYAIENVDSIPNCEELFCYIIEIHKQKNLPIPWLWIINSVIPKIKLDDTRLTQLILQSNGQMSALESAKVASGLHQYVTKLIQRGLTLNGSIHSGLPLYFCYMEQSICGSIKIG